MDPSASWKLTGVDTIGSVVNSGTSGASGSLAASAAIDPSSKGLFLRASGATLGVAAALGTSMQMNFSAGSGLLIDHVTSLALAVATGSYTGPLPENFGGSAIIDLKNFASAGASLNFNTATGLLPLTNGGSQTATLDLQVASLDSRSFHGVSDGGGGFPWTLS